MLSRSALPLATAPAFGALCIGLAAWQVLALLLRQDFLPDVPATCVAFVALLGDSATWKMLLISLSTMLSGYALAFLVGVPLGLAMGRNARLYRLVNPLLVLTYPLPKAALMPVITLWFGLGAFSKVLMIFLGASLPLVYHSYVGAANIDNKLIWQAQAFGMRQGRLLAKVVFPSALPEIFVGCRVGLSMALILMISSELTVRQAGIGDLMFNALDMAQYDTVYAVIVLIAMIGTALDLLLGSLRRYVIGWAEQR